MKKKILFVMNNLTMGGAENSLVSLLQVMDYTRYDVDLLLFKKEGFFLNSVPSQVTVLSPVKEFNYFDMPIAKAFLTFRYDVIYARICYLFLKNEKNAAVKEQRFWKYLRVCIPKLNGNYDVAIGFLEKTPNYYCVDKVTAAKKIGFIRTDYETMGMDRKIDLPYFEKLDFLFSNSEKAEGVLKNIFPQFSYKIQTIQNVFSIATIEKLSNEPIDFPDADLVLVSLGRLVPLKGFELAVASCKIIKDKGIDIKWALIGEGSERGYLESLVLEYDLKDTFYILGEKENPFPYIKKANFYVHTSKYEGKSRAIEEAKILNKPILSTRYPSILDQISDGVTGIIVDFSADQLAEMLLKLKEDKALQQKIIANLQMITTDNKNELNKFYSLLDKL